jgi:hypothetical protein
MPANRRRIAATAPYDKWVLLGKLLTERRRVLGYTYRAPGFERDTGINRRLSADLETAAAKRVNHFTEGSLRLAAHGYQVTYSSMMAVLRGDAGKLAPAAPPGRTDDQAPEAAVRPYADRIWERLWELAGRGITAPDGAAVFGEGTADAKTWDDISGRWDVPRRVWMIAELQQEDADPGRRRDGTEG